MRKKYIVALCGVMAIFNSACTHEEAATLGTAIGRPVGYPLGVAAVAVGEVFGTAGDISKASVRSKQRSDGNTHQRNQGCANNCLSSRTASYDKDTKYYETKLVIKSKGPMEIEDVYFKDSSDVTEFWK